MNRQILVPLTLSVASLALAQTQINVNTGLNRRAINPNIYGTNHATQAQMSDLNFTLNRNGGNNTSRYNWQQNADNRGSDWYFQSIPDASATAGERIDSFITATKNGGGQPLITVPMLPYVAKVGTGRSKLWSFSISKYGPQTGNDWQWNPDSGNGISTAAGNPFITGNNPLDANVANSVSLQSSFLSQLITKWGNSSGNGVKYFVMDNEPALWNSTHRDVHPAGNSYDELYNLYSTYANAVRTADANAQIIGPEEWGWTGYFYSGRDAAHGAANGWGGPFPDKSTHGNMDHIPWFLQRMKQHHTSTGKHLLNVFSLHYYPQQGEFSEDDSAAMRTIRNRSTRSLWDPNYTDTSWINDKVRLIPRMKEWVTNYYPGLQTALTEYNWGAESKLNGATTQADILGIFGREGLDMSNRWTTPATGSPTYLAMKIYRNYNGLKATFGNTSVSCTVPNPDNLSAFAAERSSDGAVTVMVINKLGSSAPVKVNLAGFTPGATASVYQINSASQTSISQLANATVSANAINATVPAQSITLYVVPKATAPVGPQYDFESGTQGWAVGGAPLASVAQSSTQKHTGAYSLRVGFGGAAGTNSVYVANPTVGAGKVVTFRIWVPAGSPITSVQPYVQQGAGGGWAWTGNWQPIGSLATNAWNTLTVTVPSNAVTPLYQLGVQFATSGTYSGYAYVDAVSWP